VALRSDGDQVQINKVNILGRQNTFFVTNSGVQNRLQDNRQTRTLVTNSYIEGDVDIVSGRGAVVFDNTDFRRELAYAERSLRFRPGNAEKHDLRLPGDQQPFHRFRR
jgi:Pectin methylesterase